MDVKHTKTSAGTCCSTATIWLEQYRNTDIHQLRASPSSQTLCEMGGRNLTPATSYAETPTTSSLCAAPSHAQSGSYSCAKSLPGLISGNKQDGTSIVDPQEILSSQLFILWPFAVKRVIEKSNSNKNLSVFIPVVPSIHYFIRNVENYQGNPVPTGTTVISEKKIPMAAKSLLY